MAKKKECPFCGGKYKDTLPACPYCGTMNYKGAEAQYLNKLENVRTDMEALGSIPEQETRAEFKRQGRFLVKALIICGVVAVLAVAGGILFNIIIDGPRRDPQAEYRWKQINYPIYDEAYAAGDYEQLLELYQEARNQDYPIDDWEHIELIRVMDDLTYSVELIEKLNAGEELSDYSYENLLYYGWKADGSYIPDNLTEEEIVLIQEDWDIVLQDFYTRWEFTDKEREAFVTDRDESYGYPDWDLVEDYIKRWKKENKK